MLNAIEREAADYNADFSEDAAKALIKSAEKLLTTTNNIIKSNYGVPAYRRQALTLLMRAVTLQSIPLQDKHGHSNPNYKLKHDYINSR